MLLELEFSKDTGTAVRDIPWLCDEQFRAVKHYTVQLLLLQEPGPHSYTICRAQ